MLRRFAVPVLVGILCLTTATAAQASGGHHGNDLVRLKFATAKYLSVRVAEQAGYGRFTDINGVACIDMPGQGAMGVHYVNVDLVGDPAIQALRPEAMVYEPTRSGWLRLVAVEYVVVKADWDATHPAPPRLFGRRFDFTDSPNRYGLPPFYSLHVWVWKHNPAGVFTMWNPRVHCPSGSSGGHAHHH